MSKPCIGLDFGTTCSSIYVYNTQTNKPEARMNSQPNAFIPTLISFMENDNPVFGFDAEKTQNYVSDIKRTLGITHDALRNKYSKNNKTIWDEEGIIMKSTESKLDMASKIKICDENGNNERLNEQIAGKFIQWLVETVAGIEIDLYLNVVITIPADFTVNQRKAILAAAKEAGFDDLNITLLHEPSAAAIVYFQQPENADKSFENLLVCDFGGGTFDLSLLSISKEKFEVKMVYGDHLLGGRDFDLLVYQWFTQKCKEEFDFNPDSCSKIEKTQIIKQCQEAKEKLSSQTEAEIKVNLAGEEIAFVLTQVDFDSIASSLIEKAIESIGKIIELSEISIESVDGVLLVGGSSNIPLFSERIKDFFGEEKLLKFDKRREAIAMGACYLAAMNEGLIGHGSLTTNYNQKLAHSIGIRTEENRNSLCVFSPILPKNTLIPCSHQQEYTNPNGELVGYYIHETDEKYTSENDLIDFLSQKIPRAGRGELKIVVTMAIDKNGILNTHCTCERSEDVSKTTNLLIDSNIFKEFVNRFEANKQFLPEYKKNEKDCARHMNHLNEMQSFSLED